MRMLDRWAMDEKMFPEDPIGIEKQNGPFITYHSNGTKSIEGNVIMVNQLENGLIMTKMVL